MPSALMPYFARTLGVGTDDGEGVRHADHAHARRMLHRQQLGDHAAEAAGQVMLLSGDDAARLGRGLRAPHRDRKA